MGNASTKFVHDVRKAMEEYENPRLRALLIRTTLEEQQELEDLPQRMYEPKGALWVKRRWRFRSGATIRPTATREIPIYRTLLATSSTPALSCFPAATRGVSVLSALHAC